MVLALLRSMIVFLGLCLPALGQVRAEAQRPVLLPGSGWSAPTQPQVRGGPYAELVAIGHWTRMEGQIRWRGHGRDFHLGVLAVHRSGIERVELAVDGGPWVVVEEHSVSPEIDHYEYGVRLRERDLSPGWHEVRARVVPRAGVGGGGTDRILSTRFFDGHGLVPGVDYGERWVHPVVGSDTASGTREDPFQTIVTALNDLGNGSLGAEGAVVHLMGPSDIVVGLGGVPQRIDNELPLTLRAEGEAPWFCPQAGEALPVRHLRLEGLRIDASRNHMFTSGSPLEDEWLYFEDCLFVGHTVPRRIPPPDQPTVVALTGLGDYAHGAHVFMADCRMRDLDGSCHARVGWMRGVRIAHGLVGGIAGSRCVIDTTVVDCPETQNVSSSGLWVGSPLGDGQPVENLLFDSVRILDHQGLLLDVRHSVNGVGVVNCTFDGYSGNAFAQNRIGSLFVGMQRHIVVQHCTSPLRLELQYPSNWLFGHMTGGLMSHSIFGDVYDGTIGGPPLNANPGGDPTNDGLSGLGTGWILDPDWTHVHGNRPTWAAWTVGNYAATYTDFGANDLSVLATSPASQGVPAGSWELRFDQRGRRRGVVSGRTTVGALRGLGE